MYDIDKDPEFRIADAGEILDGRDIVLFTIDAKDDPEAAWRDLAAEHGNRIAVAQPQGDQLVISWHYNLKPVAWWIRQAFRSVGMRATWGGEVWNAVRVDLTTVHSH